MDISFSSSPARGDTYELGETIEVRVKFDRAITATGKPQVALTIGTQTRHATFFGWGRQHLSFTYNVQEEDRDEDGISIAANALVPVREYPIWTDVGSSGSWSARTEPVTDRESVADSLEMTTPETLLVVGVTLYVGSIGR